MHRLADIGVLLFLAALVALYGIDAARASTAALNLIFVLPVAVVLLLLCAGQLVVVLRAEAVPQEPAQPLNAIAPGVALFGVYVVSLQWAGFDVGTFLFLGAFLWLKGERRWFRLLAYSLGFAIVVSVFFSQMLPYPMPMRILPLLY